MSVVGVLALQGAFREHVEAAKRAGENRVTVVEVRTAAELDKCDALIIPGGESTTMKIILANSDDNMAEKIRCFIHDQKKPVWGTCAGCILLSNTVYDSPTSEANKCKFGQPWGGLDIEVCRNFFGRQIASFECALRTPEGIDEATKNAFDGFHAVFIRAPAILKAAKENVVATILHPKMPGQDITVAAKFGNVLVTCFHPELTDNCGIHKYFIDTMIAARGA